MVKKKKSQRNVFLGCSGGDYRVPCNKIRGVDNPNQSSKKGKEREVILNPSTPADALSKDLLATNSVLKVLDELIGDINPSTKEVFSIDTGNNNDNNSLLLTQPIHLKYTPELSHLCHLSKNLYNYGNFKIREKFFHESFHGVNELLARMGSGLIEAVRDSKENYKPLHDLNAQASQQTLRYLRKAWKGYRNGLREWKDSKKTSGKPSIPGYKPKNGELVTIFPGGSGGNLCSDRAKQHFKDTIREGRNGSKTAEILFPKKVGIAPVRIRLNVNGLELSLDSIHEVRIVPRGNHYICEVVYEKEVEKRHDLIENHVLGIDLGVNVLLAIGNNYGKPPILIKGGSIKSANYNAHKQNANTYRNLFRALQAKLDSFKDDIAFDRRDDILNSCARILNYRLEYQLKKLKNGKRIIPFVNSKLSLNDSDDTSMDVFTLSSQSDVDWYHRYLDTMGEIPHFINKQSKRQYKLDIEIVSEEVSEKIDKYITDILALVDEYHLKIQNIWYRRNCRVFDQLHKASRHVVNYALEHHVSKIVIGYNKGWKREARLGNRNNQNFQSIPHLRLTQMIEYKCALVGIEVFRVDESYSSKCSALDLEPICDHEQYAGVRTPLLKGYISKNAPRGLFRSREGRYIHSDVNAAFNIMRLGVKGCLDGFCLHKHLIIPRYGVYRVKKSP